MTEPITGERLTKSILFFSEFDDPRKWRGLLESGLPQFRVECWPEIKDPSDVEYAVVWNPPRDCFKSLVNIKAIFSLGAGVDSLLTDDSIPADIPIVRLLDAGLARQMSHYAIYGVLHFQRQFFEYRRLQAQEKWSPLPVTLANSFTVGVLGFGTIGRVIASDLENLGFPVIGWANSSKSDVDAEVYVGVTELDDFLASSQLVINVLPLTAETRGLCDERFFGRMRPGSYFINLGRGGHVIESDLEKAIDSGRLAGAMLDVFASEPLSPKSSFWKRESVLITPHISGVTLAEEASDQIISNICLIESGQSPNGVVDRVRGY